MTDGFLNRESLFPYDSLYSGTSTIAVELGPSMPNSFSVLALIALIPE